MKKMIRAGKGKYVLGILLLIMCTFLTACFKTELDHDEHMIKQEQKYQEYISDTKDNDRETEQELDEIMDAVDDVSDAGSTVESTVSGKVNVQKESKEVSEEKKTAEAEAFSEANSTVEETVSNLQFRKKKYLDEHYEKHGVEMGFDSPEAYLAAANAVVANPDALHKKEKEDNDDVYYVEDTNEFVVVSGDGYIRTYFNPSAGIDYYNRQ